MSRDRTGVPGRAFISYCRGDATIALRLARDLRAAGTNVWVDQLDIEPGQRWDRAVEQALHACQRMLVVLSPESVESTNVMDEVSFALEERKLVIPVIHRSCTIPFRLRRLQRVDLEQDYDRGLNELSSVLATGPSPVPTAASSVSLDPAGGTTSPGASPASAIASGRHARPRATSVLSSPGGRAAGAGLLGALGGVANALLLDRLGMSVGSVPILPPIVVGLVVGVLLWPRPGIRPIRAAALAVLSGLGWLAGDAIGTPLFLTADEPASLMALFVWGALNVVPTLGVLVLGGAASRRPSWWAATVVAGGVADLVFYRGTWPSEVEWGLYLGAVMACIGVVTHPGKADGR